MRFFAFLFLLFQTICFAQQSLFHYKTSDKQTFNIQRGTKEIFHYLKIDRGQIEENTLFEIDNSTKKMVIPQDGFYEIKASFNFNPNTTLIKNNRGGVNFGIVQISEENEQFIAATRKSFDQENQTIFSKIKVYPTIVYLQKGVAVAPAVNSGLMGTILLGSEIGCDKKERNCVSFEWEIKLISSEKAYQKYF